jgi:hypothetical protein
MNISEAEINAQGERKYRTLYDYKIRKNTVVGNSFLIEGLFNKPGPMSDALKQKLMQHGIPQNVLRRFSPAEAFK